MNPRVMPISILLAAFLLLTSAGCAGDIDEEWLMGEGRLNLIVTVDPSIVSVEGILEPVTVTVKNNSENIYETGYGFRIERFNGRRWILVPPGNNVINPDTGHNIEPGEEFVQTHILALHDFKFTPGRYRAAYFDDWYAEFTIS